MLQAIYIEWTIREESDALYTLVHRGTVQRRQNMHYGPSLYRVLVSSRGGGESAICSCRGGSNGDPKTSKRGKNVTRVSANVAHFST